MSDAEIIRRLREEVEELREMVGRMESGRNGRLIQIAAAFGLTAQQSALLDRLHQTPTVPVHRAALFDAIETASPACTAPSTGKHLEVIVFRVRQRIGFDAIYTVSGLGYGLSPAMKQKVDTVLLRGREAVR